MDTVTPLVQVETKSDTALQKGQSKPKQFFEIKAADCLDYQQPEIHTTSPNKMTSESAEDIRYPQRDPASHMPTQLTSALGNRERPPSNQDSESPEHSTSDSEHVPLLASLHGQSGHTEAQHAQGSSDLSADAEEHECLIPYSVFTKTE